MLLRQPRDLPSPELLQAAKAGDAKALHTVVTSTMWLVRAQVRRANRPHLTEDLTQAGLTGAGTEKGGLLQAIRTYDPARGANFWSHANIYVRHAIRRAVAATNPINHRRLRRRHLRIEGELRTELGREPTRDELTAGLGYDAATMFSAGVQVSLDDAGYANAGAFSDKMSEGRMVHALAARQVVELIPEVLPEKERIAFTKHIFENMTFTEIGAEMGLSREWARQYYLLACKRLKAAMADRAA